MNDADLNEFTVRTMMALVDAMAERDYDKAEIIVTALAQEYGYDAEAVFREARS